MRVAIAGGTGLIGRHVVRELRGQGHEAVVFARSEGVDLLHGDGLAARLRGVDAVIDVSNTATQNRARAVAFFAGVTERLLAAEAAAGVAHHVALSIVGIDEIVSGYYAGKLRQEALVLASGAHGTVLRATQFHEFPGQVMARTTLGPVTVMPRMRAQPIAAREVAQALVDAVARSPAGRLPDLAGPRVEEMVDLARQLLTARGSHKLLVPLRVPGSAGRATASGALLPSGPGPRGQLTFGDWLRSEDASEWL